MMKHMKKQLINDLLSKDPELAFDDPSIYTYTKKLEKLNTYENELIKQDRDRLENRLGLQTICRISGSISQSYFVFDNRDFEVAHKIYNVKYNNLRSHFGLPEEIKDSSSEAEDH